MNITVNLPSSKSANNIISSLALPGSQRDGPGSRGFPDVDAAGANIPRRAKLSKKSFFLGGLSPVGGSSEVCSFPPAQDFLLSLVSRLPSSQH